MMRQGRFTLTPALSLRERAQDAPPSVILSGDHARTGNQRLPRRNLGRGSTSGSAGSCLPTQDSSLRSE